MISSYQLSERVNAQTLLWDACGLLVAGIRKTAAIVGRAFAILSHIEPYALGCAVGLVLGLALFAAVSAIPVAFWLGLAITGAFAYVTFPRSKSGRPGRCPYCKSTDVDAARGWAECRDCGKSWSY